MKKKDLRYINNESAFLDYSHKVFGKYFSDEGSFIAFYKAISTKEEMNKFLKIASFYKFLIIDGQFLNTKDKSYNEYIDYLDLTYKYIAIFSFIEDLYTKEEYKEFYSWLKNETTFPITTTKALDGLYKAYNEIHGSTRKAIRFFESLDDETKKIIQERFEVRNGGQSFTDLAKLFYEIRNNFIHNAELIAQFNNTPPSQTYFSIGNKKILTSLSFGDIKLIFERGFLIYFGYDKADFENNRVRYH